TDVGDVRGATTLGFLRECPTEPALSVARPRRNARILAFRSRPPEGLLDMPSRVAADIAVSLGDRHAVKFLTRRTLRHLPGVGRNATDRNITAPVRHANGKEH